MASEWQVRTINEIKANDDRAIAIGPFGSRMKADLYVSRGVPVIRGNNISNTRALVGDFAFVTDETADELRGCNVFPGDLVFPHRGAIGEVGVVPEGMNDRYMLSTSLMKLTCNRELVDPLFVFYFFRSPRGRHSLLQNSSTVGTPGIGQPLASLKSIALPVPSLSEQHAIAHILGTLDDKIELNRRINETMEAMARALFKSWFVDFDPVRAKAEGRSPNIPRHIADHFPNNLIGSELGSIPDGWVVKDIYAAADVIYGAPFSSALFNGDGVGKPLVRIRDLPNELPKVFTSEVHPKSYLIAAGDIVVGMDGEFRAHLWGGEEAWLNQRVCAFKPKAAFSTAFVFYSILGPLADVEATETATTVIHLGKNDIDRFRIAIPSIQVRQVFADFSDPIFCRIVKAKKETSTLVSLRDALIPKLISGELRVKDAEKFVEAVA